MCVVAHRRFTAGATTPSAARHFSGAAVISTLKPAGWDLADDTALLISEFVTNAVVAGASVIDVGVVLHYDQLEISVVSDTTEPAQPPSREGSDAGAQIVDALSSERGTTVGNGSTSSWAHLPCDPSFTTHIECDRR